MCAWLRTTASIADGEKGNSRLLCRDSARRPTTRPQSKSNLEPLASTRCLEPVTDWAAPQKVTIGADIRCVVGVTRRIVRGRASLSDRRELQDSSGTTGLVESKRSQSKTAIR